MRGPVGDDRGIFSWTTRRTQRRALPQDVWQCTPTGPVDMPPEALLRRERWRPSPERSEPRPPDTRRVADEILTSLLKAEIEHRQVDNAMAGMGSEQNYFYFEKMT